MEFPRGQEPCPAGSSVVFNGSRYALASQRDVWPDIKIIWVTASRGTAVARPPASESGLAVSDPAIPPGALVVENDGSLAEGIGRMEDAILTLISRA